MIYDERDRAKVRNAVIAITMLAWILLWIRSIRNAAISGLHMHQHDMNRFDLSASAASAWLLMLAAMMSPILIWPIQFVRSSTFKSRRTRSALLFVAGYTAVWLFAGILILFLAAKLGSSGFPPYIAIGEVFFIALLWQCSPAKQVCLNRCHMFRTSAAFGRSADIDAFLFGGTHGVWCTGSCWTWMLLPFLFPTGHFIAMIGAAILIFCERLDGPRPVRWRWRGLGRACRIIAGRLQIRLPWRAAT